MSSKNNGVITITATVGFFFSTIASRATFSVYYSTIGIPALGASPAGGDVQLTFTYVDIGATTNVFSLSLTGRQTTAVGVSFFLYLGMMQASAGGTLNLVQAGGMTAIEG